ncbi:MAG: LytTR family DNA-binding domain-containing protein [Bacteroidota bacterium]|nr:LytTR family DNA-binding domain-containing protein [Bacteroidota bacterium]MDP4216092.1 LytTR family DNA-binding domain-containing protein [Bacteroidota bacterium]MDP4245288.1 LytTR family DNA-binding domain-containing protein [Bacteroidota bacterium]MDP4253055.1 LytTR family DNA-binding domain-containing protein [Bacteroidota bacterium]MDP4260202.1 LytTR family DNA-binding domain-containing protein [Bacteroidota bacterium]
MLKRLSCLIVDDEPLAIDVIENYLQRIDNVDIRRCENAIEAFKLFQEVKFDLVFLDIEMPLLTGIDFLKSIKNPPAIIITTAYRDYAVEGFEWEVLDYLVKPISFPRFMKAFERAIKGIRTGSPQDAGVGEDQGFLFLKTNKKMIKILTSELLYVESLKDYIKVVTTDHTWISYQTLTSITEKLPPARFMRIHRSFTIALDKVDAVEGNCVLIAGQQIPISRECRQDLLKRIPK